MSALTQVRAQHFLNAEYGGAVYTALAAGRKLKLIATNGNEATAGTEIALGGGYTAGGPAITWAAAAADAAAPATYSGKIENVALSITNMPAATVNGVEVTDTAATPVRVAWGALTTARTTAAGDTLSFAAASVVARV